MATDIHCHAEVKNSLTREWERVGKYFSVHIHDRKRFLQPKTHQPFYERNSSVFAFFADVNNYSKCEYLSKPKGFPTDASIEVKTSYELDREVYPTHSTSFLTLRELTTFDYNNKFLDRRTVIIEMKNRIQISHPRLLPKGQGRPTTYKDHLGPFFFKHLEELKQLGAPDEVRIVFWFDN